MSGGWGGVLLTGLTTAAGIATGNDYLVGGGMSAARSYADSYEKLNTSLIEEQRQNRLMQLEDMRKKNYARFEKNLNQPQQDFENELKKKNLESEMAYREGVLKNDAARTGIAKDSFALQKEQFDSTKSVREHEKNMLENEAYRENYFVQIEKAKGAAAAEALRQQFEQQKMVQERTTKELESIGLDSKLASVLSVQQATGVDVVGLLTAKTKGQKMGDTAFSDLQKTFYEQELANLPENPTEEEAAIALKKANTKTNIVRAEFESAPDVSSAAATLGTFLSSTAKPGQEGALLGGNTGPVASMSPQQQKIESAASQVLAGKISIQEMRQKALSAEDRATLAQVEKLVNDRRSLIGTGDRQLANRNERAYTNKYNQRKQESEERLNSALQMSF